MCAAPLLQTFQKVQERQLCAKAALRVFHSQRQGYRGNKHIRTSELHTKESTVERMAGNPPLAADVVGPVFASFLGFDAPLRIDLWDGSSIGGADAKARVRINSVDAFRRILWSPGELGLSRAFVMGDIEIEGDSFATLSLLTRVQPNAGRLGFKTALTTLKNLHRLGAIGTALPAPTEEARQRGKKHSRRRDSAAISHHYDVGNEFYRLVLGKTMTYSCARFIEAEDSLDQAQTDKYDLICRKLGLNTGEGRGKGMRLLDVGCGWGGMVLHAAQNYGVTAVGITLSQQQATLARERVAKAGLSDKIEIRVQDYRDLGNERFDAISSIGMFEHVGRHKMAEYFTTLNRVLEPQGRLLNHAIDSVGSSLMPENGFVARYVFPDGELQDLSVSVGAMQDAGFEVRDVESLREHYDRTLRHWVANLEKNWAKAVELVGIQRARVWWIYMVGSAVSFESNKISIHQTLATKTTDRGEAGMPLTRAEFV